ncbi:MAG: GMP/IMP nucleotidase [gamma proteobacterium symbiont of Bathyaustriella thionipta]|nr:GMP/IMP nucleotidase [gamma proteobacterium symbiont of Bathyaustriella thionipta]MCU7950158.1 GMP/IMP nucleotidase [gamma proteobacterium symbiont of Bathyaustriella thionipta]MCU7953766.1 GMP/IMP nucleotidase [gamma proteobacterium symbiont of Bathyaustriella thionipta]MCU7958239.1 GMP/IMP nucleotidase [gamma proteobacterium symbiont of Bathyaustriella thionipta]MCU7967483.1 GMP/IMP nucleotidase [gamma proteobacterium symbiont of Bathyaustriella thionipta]
MLDWNKIDNVFLDMDGTLLDLHFDNHFWLDHVPQRYAEKHGLSKQEALNILIPLFKSMEGTIDWYCVDYWSKELDLDIALLKEEVKHLIQIHPFVVEFLEQLKKTGKHRVLVTNAHQKSLALKMKNTPLSGLLGNIISAHQLGIPKEETRFWEQLTRLQAYNPQRTLLIDDNLSALSSAREYGIKHLLAIYKPDSQADIKDVGPFQAIHSFNEIMPE